MISGPARALAESIFGRQRTLSGGNTTSLRPGGCERASMGSVGEVKEVLK